MENKRKNNLRRPKSDNMRGFHSALTHNFKLAASAYTLVVLLTFGLVQSGKFFTKLPFILISLMGEKIATSDNSSGNSNGVNDKKNLLSLGRKVVNENKISNLIITHNIISSRFKSYRIEIKNKFPSIQYYYFLPVTRT